MSLQKRMLIVGGVFAGLAVAIGAFGAHALKSTLIENGRVETFELAVKYQFYHALALLIIGAIADKSEQSKLKWSGYFLISGTTIFSGSLYLLSISGITFWGAVTPIGGILLLLGWTFYILSVLRKS